MESHANFYLIDIDEFLDIECESNYKFTDIDKLELTLPYQKKSLKREK